MPYLRNGGYVYGAGRDAFQWISGADVKDLRGFAFSIGDRYRDLEPDADLVWPEKDYNLRSFEGWA